MSHAACNCGAGVRADCPSHRFEWLARTRSITGDETVLGFDRNGGPGGCYPMRPFFVRLPGGMQHHFESEADARRSSYWPSS